MDSISPKKIVISYIITSVVIFFVSAAISVTGFFEANMGSAVSQLSVELMILFQLAVVLTSNLILHGVFYFGGFSASPFAKGACIGSLLGIMYFLIGVFAFDFYDLNNEMLSLLSAVSGRVVEYSAGGITAAIISVSDVHRWGLLRAF